MPPQTSNLIIHESNEGKHNNTALVWATASSQERLVMKLCLCRCILYRESIIPPSVFSPHPSLANSSSGHPLCHVDSRAIAIPFVRTNYHKASFFVSTAALWNSVPERIATMVSGRAFKQLLKTHLKV